MSKLTIEEFKNIISSLPKPSDEKESKKVNYLHKGLIEQTIRLVIKNGDISYLNCFPTTSPYIDYTFLQSCEVGNLEFVKEILKRFDIKEESFNTSFEIACARNKLNIVEFLIDKLFDPKFDEQTCLKIASEKENVKLLKILLKNNNVFNFNLGEFNSKIFRTACKNGNLEFLKVLLENDKNGDVDVHANGEEGIRLASENRHISIVEYLLRDNNKLKIDIDIDDGELWMSEGVQDILNNIKGE